MIVQLIENDDGSVTLPIPDSIMKALDAKIGDTLVLSRQGETIIMRKEVTCEPKLNG